MNTDGLKVVVGLQGIVTEVRDENETLLKQVIVRGNVYERDDTFNTYKYENCLLFEQDKGDIETIIESVP